MLNESGNAVVISNSLISTCDEIIYSLNSGNLQGAVNSALHARNLAVQVAQSTQELNRAINERMEVASYVLGAAQQRITELAGALQAIRSTQPALGSSQLWQSSQIIPQQTFMV